MSHSLLAIGSLAGLSALAALAPIAGCSSDKAKIDVGGQGVATYQPEGCGYQIGAVQNFPLLETHLAAGNGAPKKVRLGLGGQVVAGQPSYADPSKTFAVLWQTDPDTKATQLQWGESAGALSHTANGVSYVIEATLGAPSADGNRWHEAHVCGLQPGRTYYYRVGGGAPGQEQWSPTYTVTTAPAPGTDAVRIGVAGDTRFDDSAKPLRVWEAITGRFKAGGAHAALVSGDFVYAGYDQALWDVWTSAANDAANGLFLAMTPGNHDNEQLVYYAQALMPGTIGANYERYSSFDYGPVHVIAIDDYDGIVATTVDDSQYKPEVLAWLDADLQKANANRANVPWIVTFHHHPFFSSTTQSERATERANVIGALQPMWDKYHVDVDFAGHDHFFERSKPIVGTNFGATGGTTYVISAGGGAPNYSTTPGLPQSAKIQEYDATTEGMYSLIDATRTSFTSKTYKLKLGMGTQPTDDAVVDTFTLSK